MSLPATDDFLRANETPLAGNWTAPDGVADSKFLLVSNHVEGQGATTIQLMYWNADSFSADHKSQATLGGADLPAAATYAGVAVRVQAAGQSAYLFGVFAGSGSGYKIQRLDAGVRTNLQNCTGSPTAGDVLRLEINGTALTAYVNGSVVSPLCTDATYTGGAPGLFGYNGSGNFTLDDFTGDNLTAPPPPPPGTMDGPFRILSMAPRGYPIGLRSHAIYNLLTNTLRAQDQQFQGAGQWQTYDYPNPRHREYPSQLRTHLVPLSLTLLNQDVQFGAPGQGKAYDYPNPKRPWYPDQLRFASGVFPPLLGQQTPVTPLVGDVPPRAPVFPSNLRTLLVGGALGVAPTPNPQADWQLPRGREYPSALRTFVAYYVLDTTAPVPTSQTDWPLPKGREYPTSLRFLAGRPSATIPIPPLPPQAACWDMPVPRRAEYAASLRTTIGMAAVAIPVTPLLPQTFDWPVPRRALASESLRTWIVVGPNLPMLLPQTPFALLDWPLPKVARYPDDLRTFLRFAKIGVPFPLVLVQFANRYIGLKAGSPVTK